jgi:hypothetical protein
MPQKERVILFLFILSSQFSDKGLPNCVEQSRSGEADIY